MTIWLRTFETYQTSSKLKAPQWGASMRARILTMLDGRSLPETTIVNSFSNDERRFVAPLLDELRAGSWVTAQQR